MELTFRSRINNSIFFLCRSLWAYTRREQAYDKNWWVDYCTDDCRTPYRAILILSIILNAKTTGKMQYRLVHSGTKSSDNKNTLSHLNDRGQAVMVNVSGKERVHRVAVARGSIIVGLEVLDAIGCGEMKKGDVINVSRIAGILGAKRTSSMIPMCHHVPLDHIEVDINECRRTGSLIVEAKVEAHHKTGVEMECLMAVSITLLTLYDMCKSLNKCMQISGLHLVSKTKRAISDD